MKAILEFDLSDTDQEMEHKRCVKSVDMALALWKVQKELKGKIKGCECNEDEKGIILTEAVLDMFNNILYDRGIILDDLLE